MNTTAFLSCNTEGISVGIEDMGVGEVSWGEFSEDSLMVLSIEGEMRRFWARELRELANRIEAG
jgi:hypothetical protein